MIKMTLLLFVLLDLLVLWTSIVKVHFLMVVFSEVFFFPMIFECC